MPNSTKGLASLPPERRREIASKGGKRAQELGTANRFTKESAAAAGRKSVESRRRMILSVACATCEQLMPVQEAAQHPCFLEGAS